MDIPSGLNQPSNAGPTKVGASLVIPPKTGPLPTIAVVVACTTRRADIREDEELPGVLKDARVPLSALGSG